LKPFKIDIMYDLIIIGSGPAGYVSAIRAGQMGLKAAIVEKEFVGGMCLNWGCIPSKAIMESAKLYHRIGKDSARFGIDGIDKSSLSFNWNKAVKRSDGIVKKLTSGVAFLLKKNGVEIIEGEGRIINPFTVSVNNRTMEAKHIMIATGSKSPEIACKIQGLVVEPKELFKERELPQNIVVVGETPVAIELAQAFNMMDRKVTIVVPSSQLMPFADHYIVDQILAKLKKDKINVYYNVAMDSLVGIYDNAKLLIENQEIDCDIIFNARRRKAILPPANISIALDENGYIAVDENCKTNVDSIFAVGDVNGLSYYAHVGSAEGMHVVNYIQGIKQKLDLKKYPLNMYTVPEAAQIGFTEKELKEQGVDYKISEFPMSANGKALTEGTMDGFVRILSENKYGEVLGVQIMAPNATDMIAEAAAYMEMEATVYDVAQTVHAHPTISEVFMEAGFEAVDKAIHK
jgi:dihydrolipoamide dehydrogenase